MILGVSFFSEQLEWVETVCCNEFQYRFFRKVTCARNIYGFPNGWIDPSVATAERRNGLSDTAVEGEKNLAGYVHSCRNILSVKAPVLSRSASIG